MDWKFLLLLSIVVYFEGTTGKFPDSPSANQLLLWQQSHSPSSTPYAATAHGILYPSLTASQAIGTRGHVLLQDMFLLEKMQSFNRERIPERVVHAKGAAAFGLFACNGDISKYTKARFLQFGSKVDVVVRFSTVGGELGSADTWVDPKGFAVKFYTDEGIHDLVGNNIQVFPIRDPMLFPDINRARKRNPQTHLHDPTEWWDFTSLRPETAMHTLYLFSDMGTPRSFRGMDGAGVHTFKLVNREGKPVYAKFHWKTRQPKEFYTPQESVEMAGKNPDALTEDLYNAIALGQYPTWDLKVQIMTFEQAENHPDNPFDITKFWREEEYPLIQLGEMTLNRNPENYFAQVEQLAFSPSHMVPGIEPSPDRMLHARIFAYPDSQIYRLGVNFHQIPVNKNHIRSHFPNDVNTYQRDGCMNVGDNGAGSPNYFPNSFHGTRQASDNDANTHSTFPVSGDVDRKDTGEEDNFSLPKIYLEKYVKPEERARIPKNIADFLSKAHPTVQDRFLNDIAYKIGKEFGDDLKAALAEANKAMQGRALVSSKWLMVDSNSYGNSTKN